MKGLRWRVPQGTPDELATIADQALEVVKDIMDGQFLDPAAARARLAAATLLREEICGKQMQKHSGALSVIHVRGALPRTPGDTPQGGLATTAEPDDSDE